MLSRTDSSSSSSSQQQRLLSWSACMLNPDHHGGRAAGKRAYTCVAAGINKHASGLEAATTNTHAAADKVKRAAGQVVSECGLG